MLTEILCVSLYCKMSIGGVITSKWSGMRHSSFHFSVTEETSRKIEQDRDEREGEKERQRERVCEKERMCVNVSSSLSESVTVCVSLSFSVCLCVLVFLCVYEWWVVLLCSPVIIHSYVSLSLDLWRTHTHTHTYTHNGTGQTKMLSNNRQRVSEQAFKMRPIQRHACACEDKLLEG
jgi:hypothetical protein